ETLGSPVDPVQRMPAGHLVPHGPSESMPRKLAPMLAEIGERGRSDPRWLYEPKVDGYRVLAFIADGRVRLVSRRGLELAPFFPEIVGDLSAQAGDRLILDGEIVALGADGRPSFNALQNRAQLKGVHEIAAAQRASPVVLVCFDVLHF